MATEEVTSQQSLFSSSCTCRNWDFLLEEKEEEEEAEEEEAMQQPMFSIIVYLSQL